MPASQKSLLVLCTLSLSLSACGGSSAPSNIADLLPSGTVAGWTRGASFTVQTANIIGDSTHGVTGYIDGAAADYSSQNFVAWARGQSYVNGSYSLELQIWQYAGASDASGIYSALPHMTGFQSNWTDVSGIGGAARVADTGANYWFEAIKDAYLVELKNITHDPTAKSDAQAFLAALVAGLP
jgi:hypothetical protein